MRRFAFALACTAVGCQAVITDYSVGDAGADVAGMRDAAPGDAASDGSEDSGAGSCTTGQPACSSCCGAGNACVNDGSGNLGCATVCSTSSDCPAAKPCCALSPGGISVCQPAGSAVGQQCRCTTIADCQTGDCCAPSVGGDGGVGPSVCKSAAASTIGPQPAYSCCNVNIGCANGGCCWQTGAGGSSSYCAVPCTSSSQCGGAQCATLPSGTCSLNGLGGLASMVCSP
jgi:hypothetical protein